MEESLRVQLELSITNADGESRIKGSGVHNEVMKLQLRDILGVIEEERQDWSKIYLSGEGVDEKKGIINCSVEKARTFC